MRTLAMLAMAMATVTIFPCSASAQSFYAAIRGGPGFTPDTRIGSIGGQDVVEFKTGFTGGGALGFIFPVGLRAEAELGYIRAPVTREEGVSITGAYKSYLGMINGYYDFAFFGPIKPYLGFGLGGARVNDDRQAVASNTLRITERDEWRTAFAYQARVGVSYDVLPMLDVSAGYRYVHIDGGDITPNGRISRSDALRNHSLELGLAVKF